MWHCSLRVWRLANVWNELSASFIWPLIWRMLIPRAFIYFFTRSYDRDGDVSLVIVTALSHSSYEKRGRETISL